MTGGAAGRAAPRWSGAGSTAVVALPSAELSVAVDSDRARIDARANELVPTFDRFPFRHGASRRTPSLSTGRHPRAATSDEPVDLRHRARATPSVPGRLRHLSHGVTPHWPPENERSEPLRRTASTARRRERRRADREAAHRDRGRRASAAGRRAPREPHPAHGSDLRFVGRRRRRRYAAVVRTAASPPAPATIWATGRRPLAGRTAPVRATSSPQGRPRSGNPIGQVGLEALGSWHKTPSRLYLASPYGPTSTAEERSR